MDRREFIKSAAGAVASAAIPSVTSAAKPEPDFIWSYLAHFGMNSWKDVPMETVPATAKPDYRENCRANHVRFDERVWRRTSEALQKAGCNQIVIDLAEFVQLPRHPELAVTGSWSVERFRNELVRLRGMGFEVIPKMNFSACHDSWLKDYHRMVSTDIYYRVCEDVIRDCAEIFDRPRFFHIGFDEEDPGNQRRHLLCVCRQGDLWWHDLEFFIRTTEKYGMRPWMWSDYGWEHQEEFLKRMSKEPVQCNWYYADCFEAEKMKPKSYDRTTLEFFGVLEEKGYDQLPTGSNFYKPTGFVELVDYCDRLIAPKRLLGYQMAPWMATTAVSEAKAMAGIRLLAEGIAARGRKDLA